MRRSCYKITIFDQIVDLLNQLVDNKVRLIAALLLVVLLILLLLMSLWRLFHCLLCLRRFTRWSWSSSVSRWFAILHILWWPSKKLIGITLWHTGQFLWLIPDFFELLIRLTSLCSCGLSNWGSTLNTCWACYLIWGRPPKLLSLFWLLARLKLFLALLSPLTSCLFWFYQLLLPPSLLALFSSKMKELESSMVSFYSLFVALRSFASSSELKSISTSS